MGLELALEIPFKLIMMKSIQTAMPRNPAPLQSRKVLGMEPWKPALGSVRQQGPKRGCRGHKSIRQPHRLGGSCSYWTQSIFIHRRAQWMDGWMDGSLEVEDREAGKG